MPQDNLQPTPIPALPTQVDSLRDLAEMRFTHATYRKNLRERIEGQLVVAHNGGLFKASPDLISFLSCWDNDELVIEDAYHNPILCNRSELLTKIKEAYQFAMNAWHVEFEKSKTIRKLPCV